MKKRIFTLFLLIVLIGSYSFGMTELEEVREIVRAHYVEEVPEDILNKDKVDDLIKGLQDPHTQLFSQKEFGDFLGLINNTYVGIGVRIEKVSEGLLITEIFKGSEALTQGVLVGDIITHAQGKALKEMSVAESIAMIRGEEGSRVLLQLKRAEQSFSKNIMRKSIQIESVKEEWKNGILYIEYNTFSRDSAQQLLTILKKHQKDSTKGIVLDLRNNGGGYLEAAQEVIGAFVGAKPATIVKDRIRETTLMAQGSPLIGEGPLMVLINKNSASASELTSAALADYGKGFIVGEKSFGKGSVQSMFLLGGSSSVLKMTVEHFFSPKHHVINGIGVSPDLDTQEEVDAKNLALLLLSGDEKSGISFSVAGKTFYIDPAARLQDEYWESYRFLIAHHGDGFGKSTVALQNAFFGDDIRYYQKGQVFEKRLFLSLSSFQQNYLKGEAEFIRKETGERTKATLMLLSNNKALGADLTNLEEGNYYLWIRPSKGAQSKDMVPIVVDFQIPKASVQQ